MAVGSETWTDRRTEPVDASTVMTCPGPATKALPEAGSTATARGDTPSAVVPSSIRLVRFTIVRLFEPKSPM